MKKQIDPDKFLEHITDSINNIKEMGKKAEKDNDVRGGEFLTSIEVALYGVKCAVEYATSSGENNQQEPKSQQPLRNLPPPINKEHKMLLNQQSWNRENLRRWVDIVFPEKDNSALSRNLGINISDAKDFLIEMIKESKEIDRKIAEIELNSDDKQQ